MSSPSLMAAPRVGAWLDLSTMNRVTIRTGKVEFGQGILTALAQTASERLSVSADRIEVLSGLTGRTPNEGYTAGSLSIPHSATAIEAACDTCVRRFRAHLSRQAGVPADSLALEDGYFVGAQLSGAPSLWSLAAELGLDFDVEEADQDRRNDPGRPSLPRIDLESKIGGAGLIQDIRAEGMLHTRVLRPPRLGALPDIESLPESDRAGLIVEKAFVALVDEDAVALGARADRLAARLTWSGGVEITPRTLSMDFLHELPGETVEIGEAVARENGGDRVSARYQRPYLMHASIGCVTALAKWNGPDRLDVTSQTQGPYQLRDALAALFDLPKEAVTVTHAAGAGCYGHNGADDVAADAALVARHHPGRTVRVSWTRAEELASAPLSPAGEVEISATIDAAGRPTDFRLDIVSGTHARRPGTAPHGTLLGELNAAGASDLTPPIELPAMHGFGALRNAVPPYRAAGKHARLKLVDPPGLRTSAMRGLGTYLNVFAIESFIDELAARAGADPLDYRLSMLDDPRATGVLSRVAEMAGWRDRPRGGSGTGWGIAYSRYKDRAAYAAMVARVRVEDDVIVDRIWCCADAGRVVNLDGLRNQIEGGIIQATSCALLEEVRLNAEGCLPTSWDDYPILRFEQVPQVILEVLPSPDPEPLGAGEVAVGPATAAIANAVSDALGTRIRRLPLSRERVAEAILET